MADIQKLQIFAFILPDYSTKHNPPMIELQVNPQEIDFNLHVKYDTPNASGSKKGEELSKTAESAVGGAYIMPNFKGYDKMSLTINTIIDATGILPAPGGDGSLLVYNKETKKKEPSVAKYIEKLKKTTYNYVSDKHGPPFLKVVWGTVLPSADSNSEVPEGTFLCQLVDLGIKYTLFSASGSPIRAELTLKLEGREDPKKVAGGESPDLSHFIDVKYGDNLPKLCKDIYGSPEFFLQIARINNLPSIYALEPGMKLRFPPLDKASR